MTTIVLLGGNGYIGREVTQQWLTRDPSADFYVVSRSGQNQLQNSRIQNIAADVTDFDAVNQVIPEQIDYIVDFVGRPAKTDAELITVNQKPAEVMQKIAETHQAQAMGMIGGQLGPKPFVTLKAKLIKQLQTSPVRLATVNPTLVYGAGRSDSMAKMVPLLKFFGLFSATFKPVTVSAVAQELLDQLI